MLIRSHWVIHVCNCIICLQKYVIFLWKQEIERKESWYELPKCFAGLLKSVLSSEGDESDCKDQNMKEEKKKSKEKVQGR